MIEFSKLPINSQVADQLLRKVLADIGTGTYTEDQLRSMVDEGCAAALAALSAIDGPMKIALDKFADESDKSIVEMVALTMMLKTLDRAIELKMLESLLGILGIKPGHS